MIRLYAQPRVPCCLSSGFRFVLLIFLALEAELLIRVGLADHLAAIRRTNLITNVAQFKTIAAADYAMGCDFHLSGVVTLVDTNRDLIVLQDATGAVALNALLQSNVEAGEMVVISGSNCAPAFMNFPAFPHRPALTEIKPTFEAPMNRGEYYLTRMRGWLRPPVSGHYTFWIASDNSSELWLSLESDSYNPKRIALMPRYCWVAPREFTKIPSQKSEAVWLESGKRYYIEALQEQTHGDANLAVAWQGPGIPQSIITDAYLAPWGRDQSLTNGILLEHWTNYTAGTLDGLGGARSFQSVLSVEELQVVERRPAQSPKARKMSADSKWLAENNYRWVETEGLVTFASEAGDYALLALESGKVQVQARSVRRSVLSRLVRNSTVHIEGVFEAFLDENGVAVPGAIWVSREGNVSIKKAGNSSLALSPNLSAQGSTNLTPTLEGFYGTRGVVTFNDRVFGNDCLFVQEGNAVASVKVSKFKNQLKVGDWVDLGGSLEPGRFFPTIKPMVVVPLGCRPLPVPVTGPIDLPLATRRDGRWTEIEGVARSVNTNGALSVMTAKAPISVWVGETDPTELNRYVDARLRIRGVLSATTLEIPILLVPSSSFVEVDESAPKDAFSLPLLEIVNLKVLDTDPASTHRIRVRGEVTMLDGKSFFLQDKSGGIRVVPNGKVAVKIGDAVEVVGFPVTDIAAPLIGDALVRAATGDVSTQPLKLDLTDGLPIRQNGSLVTIAATLLATRTIQNGQVLDLQEGRHVFTATVATNLGSLPTLVVGSRLQITGVCDTGGGSTENSGREKAALASINLWLRSPGDIKLLSGPPWWSWQKASALVGALLAVLMGSLLWVHLLRRRLERQRAAQLAASEQILKRLEEERRRIAANLHDSLGQVLLAIKNQTLVVLQRSPCESGVRDRLTEISGATSQAIEEVRQITHGLRPYQLDRLGLTQAMRATVNRASASSSISFASRVEDIDGAFDKDSEIHVYRIVQEAINNILKHSAATEAAVVIKKRANNVSLSIRDNGCGFDFATLHASQSNDLGYGLSGITERMRILGGKFIIDSKPGAGASLNLEIPISTNGTGSYSSDRGRSSTAAARSA